MREAAAEADFKLMGGKPPKSGNSGNASNTAGATVSANNVGGTPADPDAWKTALDYSKSGQLVNSIRNLLLILSNDPELKGIRYNALADNIEFTGKAPWGGRRKKFWRDQDDAQLMAYLEAHYGTFPTVTSRRVLPKSQMTAPTILSSSGWMRCPNGMVPNGWTRFCILLWAQKIRPISVPLPERLLWLLLLVLSIRA